MKRIPFAILLIAIYIIPTRVIAQIVPEKELHAERGRIATERRDAESRYRQEEAACYQRFAVNDCLKEADGRRRAVSTDLRHRENALNDLERKQRPPKARSVVPAHSPAPPASPALPVPAPVAPAVSRPAAEANPIAQPAAPRARQTSRQERDAQAAARAKVARTKAQEAKAKKQRLAQRKKEEKKAPVPGLPRPS